VQVGEAKAAFCAVFSRYEKGGRIVTREELSPQPHRKVMADPDGCPPHWSPETRIPSVLDFVVRCRLTRVCLAYQGISADCLKVYSVHP
jgi:hypothetical protein